MKLIDKDALVAEIEKVADEPAPSHDQQCPWEDGYYCGLYKVMTILDTLEVKEVDLEKEFDNYTKDILACDVQFEPFTHLYNCAKHFFELGIRFNNPITATDRCTAEEIIINLKRIESDYRIDLTKEIEWLRNQVKK